MGKPAYKVKIGSATFDSSLDQEIISIRVDLDMDVPSDSFEIVFKPSTKAGSIRVGDPAVIELGYDGELTRVLTGSIDVVEASISQVTISGLSRISSLTRLRINQVYEKQSAGFIVKDLAGRAGVSIGVAEEGLSFPMYVVEDAKDVYTHMKELALRCGFDLFLCADGKLAFKKYARQSAKIFKYGLNAMEADAHETIPAAACVRVFGESPSSFKGADTAHWLSKRVVQGVAGGGSPTVIVEDPTVRDTDTAERVAAALLESLSMTLSGTVKSFGNAGIALGNTIEVKDMPDSRMNGEFQATSVSHSFNKAEGFVSVIGWRKRGSASQT